MKRIFLSLLFIPFFSFAQAPVIQWIHTMGGAAGEQAACVIQTADGGYLTAGSANSSDGDVVGNHGNADVWVLKFDATGVFQWQQTLGGTGSDWADSIIQTADGGYAVAGTAMSVDGDAAGNTNWGSWIVKLTSAGAISWQKSYGSGTLQAEARQLVQSADGGYVLAGITQGNGGDVTGFHGEWDFWVIKLDAQGSLVWQKALGGSDDDQANSVQQTPDGGYIVAGWTHSTDGDVANLNGCYDGWLVKLSATGAMEWQKAMGTNNCEIINDIKVTPDGGYAYAGYRGYNALVVKTDAMGNVVWENEIGGTAQDELVSISLTADGGYAASGFAYSNDGDMEGVPGSGKAWLVRLDAAGEVLWQRTIGGSGETDIAYDIKETVAGEYITCGITNSADGDMPGNNGTFDMFIAKLVPESMGTNDFTASTGMVWPNPASASITISLPNGSIPESVTVSDSAGRIIKNCTGSSVDVSGLADGVYFVAATTGGKTVNVKFIKQ